MVNLEQVVWGLPLRPPPGEARGAGAPAQRHDPIELWGWLCNAIVPALLATAGTPWETAQQVGRDIEARGRHFASCGIAARDRLVAPLLDEAAGQEPAAARLWLRAAVLAVVRDGPLDRERGLGRVTSTDVVALTRAMTWPLSLYLALHPCPADDDHLEGVFAAPGAG
ncbi:hypothetical protein [Pseudofrankia sp. DC12]|uniref:hypothetical protein n=1 Tax=Pseudofrankia sp. DC12 TaxID=683315 RepID=UPI0005F80DD2|nr:hypothetical protein [Pseudofrankia sp. DC12]